MTATFGDRLRSTFSEVGRLCVGIDPHRYLLERWGLPDDASGLREFGLRIVDATHGTAGIVKPQVAFFERHGSAGFAALERVMQEARAAELSIIADVKRGDVGTSVEAYGEAWLTPGSPLEADCMTISAFQGVGSIEAPIRLALANGKGLFVLGATSNPEAAAVQRAVMTTGKWAGRSVAAGIVDEVMTWNAQAEHLGSIGVVLGATIDLEEFGISTDDLVGTPILAPGFGHQGAAISELSRVYGRAAEGTIVSASRSILAAGPDGMRDAIRSHVDDIERAHRS